MAIGDDEGQGQLPGTAVARQPVEILSSHRDIHVRRKHTSAIAALTPAAAH
jgi:hypothetical protein